MEKMGAMAILSLYIYHLPAATVCMWIVNSIYQNLLSSSELSTVNEFFITTGSIKPARTGITAESVDQKSQFIGFCPSGRSEKAFGDS